jgi:cyclopropane-fatty-acyl-phospholipid synthase
MTLDSHARRHRRWPGLGTVPLRAPRRVSARSPAAVPRRRRRSPSPSVGHDADRTSAAAARDAIRRPDEFFARIGRDGLIGFGEAYLTGPGTPTTSAAS